MRHTQIIAAVITVLALCASANLSAQTLRANNAQLQIENEKLKSKLDSLDRLVNEYRKKSKEDERTIADLSEAHRKATEKHEYEAFNLGANAKDSISLWDAQDRIGKITEVAYNMDSVKLDSKVSDDVYLQRIMNMNNIFTLPYNDIVRNYVILYAEKKARSIPTTLGLCSYYFPIFQEAFNKYGIPEELACMAIIESAMNPTATSRSGARGMWQFMYATAKVYGLRIDSYVDERLDVYKAADAAARYLKDAYNRFGDWSLAISSYNCGSGNVKRAIARNGGNDDYWGIYPYLPKETRGYVPAFVGALYITKYYREHGYNPKPCSLPEKVDTFMISKKLHFTQINEVIGVPVEQLRNLNPQYVHDIIPGNDRDYVLRIPEHFVEAFMENEDSIYRYKADSLFSPVVIKQIEDGTAPVSGQNRIVYKVKSGDTLSKIATKYKVNVNDLKRWNNLKSNSILKIGQSIYIYKGGATAKPATQSAPAPAPATESKPAATQPAKETAPDSTAAVLPQVDTTIAAAADTVAAVDVPVEEDEEEEVIREITEHPGLSTSTVKTEETPVQKKEFIEYTVQKGDTMFGISKKFNNVSAKDIMDLNGIDTNIHPGDVIKIPVTE